MLAKAFVLLPLVALTVLCSQTKEKLDAHDYSPAKHWAHRIRIRSLEITKNLDEESSAEFWTNQAQKTLQKKLLQKPNTNKAKNVILFLGDGMSIPTLKAARLYMGQLQNSTGETNELFFEKFPYTALSKTYCVDAQVPDSACTSTAYLSGVKANEGTLGVTSSVKLADCEASLKTENQVSSIALWSQLKHKKTGFVTTTRVTHASPAGLYSHSAHRDWESTAYDVPKECEDIAKQLIHNDVGRRFNVILGGGRQEFLPKYVKDEEGSYGKRKENNNLIDQWIEDKSNSNPHTRYVWNRTALINIENDTEYLLGLFEASHCKYHLDATPEDPSLAEMTEAAIKVLSNNNKNGFFLFVEGGRIDQAHHDNLARKALDETIEFSKAVQKASELTKESETLIVVTSDHSHVMTVSGYAPRGNDILGEAGIGDDGLSYSTLSYANGPSYEAPEGDKRYDHSDDDKHDKDYPFPSMVPLEFETHGGDDVAIFAKGPWAHLFSGVMEQNMIPNIMAFASCVGYGATMCDQEIGNEKKLP